MFLSRSLPELLPTVVAVSVALGLILTGGLYLWRPKAGARNLSARRAGAIGALSSVGGYLALQATVLGGLFMSSWVALLASAVEFSLVGAAAGIALQRIATFRTVITSKPEQRAIAP